MMFPLFMVNYEHSRLATRNKVIGRLAIDNPRPCKMQSYFKDKITTYIFTYLQTTTIFIDTVLTSSALSLYKKV